jgi:hypothetical protein
MLTGAPHDLHDPPTECLFCVGRSTHVPQSGLQQVTQSNYLRASSGHVLLMFVFRRLRIRRPQCAVMQGSTVNYRT